MQLASGIQVSEFNRRIIDKQNQLTNRSMMGPIARSVLYALVCIYRPKVIVETGGNLGMTSTFILKAIQDAGIEGARLYSIERDKRIVHGSFIPDELRGPFVPLAGAVEDFLNSDEIPQNIDMFLHDSTHRYAHQIMEFEKFWMRLGKGGLLCSHDVDMNSAFTEFISRNYIHDEGGISIPDKTAHTVWGCFAEMGFLVKA